MPMLTAPPVTVTRLPVRATPSMTSAVVLRAVNGVVMRLAMGAAFPGGNALLTCAPGPDGKYDEQSEDPPVRC